GKKYHGEVDQARLIAHKLSDAIVEQFIGQPGIAQTKIAFVSQVGKAKEIYVMDYDGARAKRITANNTINPSPSWSPDGSQIAFTSDRAGSPHIYIMNADGGNIRPFTPEVGYCDAASWSPLGDKIAFTARVPGGFDIFVKDVKTMQLGRLTEN